MTYEPDVALLNAVYKNCLSTGEGELIDRAELERASPMTSVPSKPANEIPGEYWADFRPIRTMTLEA